MNSDFPEVSKLVSSLLNANKSKEKTTMMKQDSLAFTHFDLEYIIYGMQGMTKISTAIQSLCEWIACNVQNSLLVESKSSVNKTLSDSGRHVAHIFLGMRGISSQVKIDECNYLLYTLECLLETIVMKGNCSFSTENIDCISHSINFIDTQHPGRKSLLAILPKVVDLCPVSFHSSYDAIKFSLSLLKLLRVKYRSPCPVLCDLSKSIVRKISCLLDMSNENLFECCDISEVEILNLCEIFHNSHVSLIFKFAYMFAYVLIYSHIIILIQNFSQIFLLKF